MRWSLQSTPNTLWVGCVKVSALGSGSWIFAGVGPKLLLLFIALFINIEMAQKSVSCLQPIQEIQQKGHYPEES